MLKIALIVCGALVGLVVLVTLVGLLLPRGHVATGAVRLERAPDAVWAAVTTVEEFTRWRGDLKGAERLPDKNGRPVWRETDKHGQTMTLECEEWSAPRRLVTRIADAGLPFGGTWTIEIEPAGAGCTVRVTENGEVYNPIFRFMARFVFGHRATLRGYLLALAKRFDAPVALLD
ncbi:MAG: SRPBCC domain-containing protein [Phycisphaerae bacterium]